MIKNPSSHSSQMKRKNNRITIHVTFGHYGDFFANKFENSDNTAVLMPSIHADYAVDDTYCLHAVKKYFSNASRIINLSALNYPEKAAEKIEKFVHEEKSTMQGGSHLHIIVLFRKSTDCMEARSGWKDHQSTQSFSFRIPKAVPESTVTAAELTT